MSRFECSFKTGVLNNTGTHMIAFIPDSSREPYPVLYLLHGLSDDETTWSRMTTVEMFSREYDIAVIMPDCKRSFYNDMVHGMKYFSFLTDDLPNFCRRMLPITKDREKTYICGNSMGGYGAYLAAFRRPDLFSKAISLSGALDVVEHNKCDLFPADAPLIWGEDHLTSLPGSDADLFALSENAARSEVKPELLQICGSADMLYGANLKFRDHISKLGFKHEYFDEYGEHNWHYWERWLPRVFDFIGEKA